MPDQLLRANQLLCVMSLALGPGFCFQSNLIRDLHRIGFLAHAVSHGRINLRSRLGELRENGHLVVEDLGETTVDQDAMFSGTLLYTDDTSPQHAHQWRAIFQDTDLTIVCGNGNKSGLTLEQGALGRYDTAME